ncbi:MAG: hypothetical protein IPO99_02810 [Nitrospira sp.]|nr:hypothetical protein [Nitrospira sp.]
MSGNESSPFSASLSLIVMIRLSMAQDRGKLVEETQTVVSNPFMCRVICRVEFLSRESEGHEARLMPGRAGARSGKIAEVRSVVNAYKPDR